MNWRIPALAIFTALLTSGCEREAPSAPPEPPAASSEAAPASEPAAEWYAALADPARPDRARDLGRKPVQVIEFLGIEPGMTVMDLFTAGGYYTEVLAAAVGPEGKVYAQNPGFMLKFNDGAADKQLSARLADNRLPNVVRLDAELDDLGLAPESLDAVTFALNFHDVYNARGEETTLGLLQVIKGVLKPGGVLGLIDHVGDPGNDNSALHRIDPDIVRDLVTRAGFVIEAESSVLANPEDDHTQRVFAPGIRGKTDRFLMRIRKPATAA